MLLKFEDNWVVHDYLRIYLKNSAQKAKKDQQNKDKDLITAAKGKGRGASPMDPRVHNFNGNLDQRIDTWHLL